MVVFAHYRELEIAEEEEGSVGDEMIEIKPLKGERLTGKFSLCLIEYSRKAVTNQIFSNSLIIPDQKDEGNSLPRGSLMPRSNTCIN